MHPSAPRSVSTPSECFRSLLGSLAVALCLGASFPESASAFCRTTTKTLLTGSECITDGTPLRWERQCLTFTVQSEDPAIRDAVDRSFAAWTEIQCDGQPIGISIRQTEETATCSLAEYNSDAPNMNAILFVDDWAAHRELPPDAFAITLVWNLKDTGEIVDADMLINPTLGNLTICGAECADRDNDIDIQNVVTHEAGHFLGLAHSDVEGATMSPTAPVGQTEKRDLAQDDRDGLCFVYGNWPVAQCSKADYVPRHGFSPDCSDPPESTAATCSCAIGPERPRTPWLGLVALCAGVLATRRRREHAARS